MKYIVLVMLLVSCGQEPDGTSNVNVMKEKITCNTNDVCSSERMTCTRVDYYSDEWDCIVFVTDRKYIRVPMGEVDADY